ncbi:MAG: hypothetical protein A2749_01070 [Parcubacteria group bacterium RIFCSPHIGHO2_01_FULL_45_26]|nr:MAG: hypothetical protein A2749_01070 [Parcubacteria group bacterium RIFCSPHIGHO2_01_FULL_45_26]
MERISFILWKKVCKPVFCLWGVSLFFFLGTNKNVSCGNVGGKINILFCCKLLSGLDIFDFSTYQHP